MHRGISRHRRDFTPTSLIPHRSTLGVRRVCARARAFRPAEKLYKQARPQSNFRTREIRPRVRATLRARDENERSDNIAGNYEGTTDAPRAPLSSVKATLGSSRGETLCGPPTFSAGTREFLFYFVAALPRGTTFSRTLARCSSFRRAAGYQLLPCGE